MRRSKKRNKQRKIIVVSLVSLLCIMTAGYAAFQTNLNIRAKGNIIEKSRTIQSWTHTSNEDFHTDFYRENIITATFLNTNKVPENAIESWDVSVDKDGGVMAYVLDSQIETGKYDLYIGSNGGIKANEDSSSLFCKFKNLTTIKFNNNFDTSNTTSMYIMFNQCNNLTNIDINSFDTSKVTDMSGMFMGCSKLVELDLSTFDTNNLTNMSAMFSGWNDIDNVTSLKTIDLSSFNTSKVTTMHDLFAYNNNLETIKGLEKFNTSNVTDISGMFYSCEKITKLNLCSFDTTAVTNMDGTFRNMTNINKIYVGSNWTTANANTSNLFYNSNISSVTTGEC